MNAQSLNCCATQSYGSAYSRWKLMFFAIGSSMKVIVRAIIVLSLETFQLDSTPFFTTSNLSKG